MSKDDFDRGFDELLTGLVDGLSGGKVEQLRSTARRTVRTVQEIRPVAAAALRRVADQLDPRSETGTLSKNGTARGGRGAGSSGV